MQIIATIKVCEGESDFRPGLSANNACLLRNAQARACGSGSLQLREINSRRRRTLTRSRAPRVQKGPSGAKSLIKPNRSKVLSTTVLNIILEKNTHPNSNTYFSKQSRKQWNRELSERFLQKKKKGSYWHILRKAHGPPQT